jgi:two-component system response regulator NreC
MKIKIMLTEDHAMLREGLRGLIERQPDMDIVGEAKDGRAAVEMALTLKPDVIIMDVTMPDMSGIEATRQIKAQNPDIKIVALSAYDKPDFVLGMIKAGASAYLLKDNLFDELLKAIKATMEGQSYLCPEVAKIVVQACVDEGPSSPRLTQEELSLITRLSLGHSAKDIATQEDLSVKTVEGRRRRLLRKLNIDSMAELVHYAIAEGLIKAPAPH